MTDPTRRDILKAGVTLAVAPAAFLGSKTPAVPAEPVLVEDLETRAARWAVDLAYDQIRQATVPSLRDTFDEMTETSQAKAVELWAIKLRLESKGQVQIPFLLNAYEPAATLFGMPRGDAVFTYHNWEDCRSIAVKVTVDSKPITDVQIWDHGPVLPRLLCGIPVVWHPKGPTGIELAGIWEHQDFRA